MVNAWKRMPKQNCQLNLQKHPSVLQTLKSRSVVKIDIKLLLIMCKILHWYLQLVNIFGITASCVARLQNFFPDILTGNLTCIVAKKKLSKQYIQDIIMYFMR